MSGITTVFETFKRDSTGGEIVPAIHKAPDSDKLALSRKVTQKDVDSALKKKASTFNGKQFISSSDSSILGSYEGGSNIETTNDDILSRLVIEQSTHLSNWKNDSLVGNGNDKVSVTISLMPTWDSRRKFMHISRLIVWVVPTIPDANGFIKATIVDQNKMTSDEKIVISKQGSLKDPICFIFHLSWSFSKERNTPKQCMQLNLTSNEKYAKGVSFASVMYSWVKNFCDTPIAAESNTCDAVPISRAKVIHSAALIEACKLMIPKGTSGKAIANQIKSLQKVAEKLALESNSDEPTDNLDISIDDGIEEY
ncbi:MAG: nonstructural protein M [Mercurialis orthotospovirus 1]|nr:MAG: nonstructural protein M [Mercurialis orthotospovirus 1]USL90364.1 MAG: nonstructural protein M [Mercurialis orthotospovirus 1]USL90369.1 MAG: nonstructural protein M [Mercurialis orthotospovirus 1]